MGVCLTCRWCPGEPTIAARFDHMKASLLAKYGPDLIQPDCEWLFINAGTDPCSPAG